MASTDPRNRSADINILIGLASMLRPDLVSRIPPEQVRAAAERVLDEPDPIPAPFLAAFADKPPVSDPGAQ